VLPAGTKINLVVSRGPKEARVKRSVLPIGLCALIVLGVGPTQASSKKARQSRAPATKQQALAAYGNQPLAFTANAGQTDARVRYSVQGAGFSVFLTRREAMLSLQRPGKQRRGRGVELALRFLRSNRNVAIRGEPARPVT